MDLLHQNKKSSLNIHLYFSTFVNESRAFRESKAINLLAIFDSIELVGIGKSDLATYQINNPNIFIRRFLKADRYKFLVHKIILFICWNFLVFFYYCKKNITCINCHSLTVLPLSVIIKLITKSKLIYTPHELETEITGLSPLRKKIAKILERYLINYVDHTIVVSKYIEAWYKTNYKSLPVSTIYNFPEYLDVQRNYYFHQKYNLSKDKPIFLYQGILAKGRGIDLLIDAFSKLQDIANLIFMGYGSYEGNVIDASLTYPNIFFHNAVPPHKLIEFTASADYGLHVSQPISLSYEYSMPNKLFEYLMANKPVLVSPLKEQKEFVELYKVGYVCLEHTSQSIIDGVKSLLALNKKDLLDNINYVRGSFKNKAQLIIIKKIFRKIGLF